jgi:YVTN family beta-propeller protein
MRLARVRSINGRWLVAVTGASVLASLIFVACISRRSSAEARPADRAAPDTVEIAHSQRNAVLLVSNVQDSKLTFVDLGTGKVSGYADTGYDPREIAVTPDGRTAYISNYGAGDSISVIDVRTRKELRKIDLGADRDPHGIQVSRDGRKLYVTAETVHAVLEIDVATDRVLRTLKTGRKSHMLVLAPDGRRLYTSNGPSGTVTVLDLETGVAVAEIPTGRGSAGIDITPDGRTVWTASVNANTVSVVDTTTLKVVARLPRTERPFLVKITPDGRTALVSYAHPQSHWGAVVFFDVATRRELGATKTGPVIGMAIDGAGKTAYAVRADADALFVIDLRTNAFVRTIPVAGHSPCGLAIAVPR